MKNTEIVITDKIILEHGLTKEEFARIVKTLGRRPNIVELGMYSVLWSEHCSYKSSKNYLKTFPTKSPRVLAGPGENSGIVDIGGGLAISMKIESHNHPSAVEPYQGAATGVGGIVRDIFTMGARPIAGLNSLRFGPLSNQRNRYLFGGVVSGISGYGNCLGLPTVAGEVYFDDCYTGNCLVNAMCVGVVRIDGRQAKGHESTEIGPRIVKAIADGPGNSVLYVGAATGRDGIHGATFASVELSEESESRRSNVQIGDPFTEKSLIEACLEVLTDDSVVGMQDMGAAGLTCSTTEMASKSGTGMDVDIALVPQREEGMTPYEIMLSESQERMMLVVKPGTEDRVKKIFNKWGLSCVNIGKVTGNGLVTIRMNGKVVAEVPPRSLADEGPIYDRPYKRPDYLDKVQSFDPGKLKAPKDLNKVLVQLLGSPDIANKKWVYEQYDHMVQTNTMVLPGAADASVLRLKDSGKAISVTTDGNGVYCYLDPFVGGMIAVCEAARNVVCTGAEPVALTNCLNFGNPEKPEVMWQFKHAVEGMAEACRALNVPVISGNVSFYNENNGVAVHPTPVVGMLGLINAENEQEIKRCTMGFAETGDVIVLLGKNKDELGGSEYLKVIHGKIAGRPPQLDLNFEKCVQQTCLEAIRLGLVRSAHDTSEGGLAVALSECCIAGGTGAMLSLLDDMDPASLLFSETQSRIILSIPPENLFLLEKVAVKHRAPMDVIGKVGGNSLMIKKGNKPLIDIPIKELSGTYYSAIGNIMETR
jgi:phosphoribosylformylglycinamidine synthase subunit PurL